MEPLSDNKGKDRNGKHEKRKKKSHSYHKKHLSLPDGIFPTAVDPGPEKVAKTPVTSKEPTLENCNISEYLPFIKSTKCYEGTLKWMRKLRSPSPIKLPLPHVPEVYYKVGKFSGSKGVKDVPHEGNFALVRHLLTKRNGASPHKQQLDFECGLRRYHTQAAIRHETKFDASPVYRLQDSFNFPTFLPPVRSSSVVRLKKLPFVKEVRIKVRGKEQVRISAYEGPSTERYNDKFRIKNMSDARHLFGRSSDIGTIHWESGLRGES